MATTGHRVRWFARVALCPEAPDGWLPRTATMRGAWNWDVRCSCGRETHTGGGTLSYLRQLVWEHKHGYETGGWSENATRASDFSAAERVTGALDPR